MPYEIAAMGSMTTRTDASDDRRATWDATSIVRGYLGIRGHPAADEEILTRSLYQLLNEGACLLAERGFQRQSGIDLYHIHGMGFSAAKSGATHWADSVGLDRIHEAIVALQREHDDNWAPAPLLGELVRSSRRFADLNAAAAVA
jgi:3-hydroxyacyl-CoA dehydrogenase